MCAWGLCDHGHCYYEMYIAYIAHASLQGIATRATRERRLALPYLEEVDVLTP